jgi:hypothetical protein
MRNDALRPRRVHDFVSSIFDYDLHAKRVDSLPAATVGALSFRDPENLPFGMGLTDKRISAAERRDRVLLVGAIAASLLTLLGAAGESLGLDMKMKANTVNTRTHSLVNHALF